MAPTPKYLQSDKKFSELSREEQNKYKAESKRRNKGLSSSTKIPIFATKPIKEMSAEERKEYNRAAYNRTQAKKKKKQQQQQQQQAGDSTTEPIITSSSTSTDVPPATIDLSSSSSSSFETPKKKKKLTLDALKLYESSLLRSHEIDRDYREKMTTSLTTSRNESLRRELGFQNLVLDSVESDDDEEAETNDSVPPLSDEPVFDFGDTNKKKGQIYLTKDMNDAYVRSQPSKEHQEAFKQLRLTQLGKCILVDDSGCGWCHTAISSAFVFELARKGEYQ